MDMLAVPARRAPYDLRPVAQRGGASRVAARCGNTGDLGTPRECSRQIVTKVTRLFCRYGAAPRHREASSRVLAGNYALALPSRLQGVQWSRDKENMTGNRLSDEDRSQTKQESLEKMHRYAEKLAEKSNTFLHHYPEITEFLVIWHPRRDAEVQVLPLSPPRLTEFRVQLHT